LIDGAAGYDLIFPRAQQAVPRRVVTETGFLYPRVQLRAFLNKLGKPSQRPVACDVDSPIDVPHAGDLSAL
jgi:hypothetical protein